MRSKDCWLPYSDIKQEFSSGSMQDLHEVADALLPDVEGMLPGRTSHDILTITGETAALPRSPEHTKHKWRTSGNQRTRQTKWYVMWHTVSKPHKLWFQVLKFHQALQYWLVVAILEEACQLYHCNFWHQNIPTVSSTAHVLCSSHLVTYLLTRSCSFCMGSGSPSRPQVSISLPSYTLMIRSAVFMRKQLHRKQDRWTKKAELDKDRQSRLSLFIQV